MYIKLFEEFTPNKVVEFIIDMGMFTSFNLARVKDLAIDDNAEKELDEMLKTFRKPLINGMSFNDIADNYHTIKKDPKMLSAVFSQIRSMLIYIEPRIERFVKDSEKKTAWLNRLSNLKTKYIDFVTNSK
jgi:predicted aldo/keto reductase-like oxidoreductase